MEIANSGYKNKPHDSHPTATATQDDYSGRPAALRALLLTETGGEYPRFVTSLDARYNRVWRDIGLAYGALLAVAWLMQLPEAAALRVAAILPGAVAIGAALAFLQLFLHEAAHYNLAAERRWNDWLCDALISWQVASSIDGYRAVHFAHHRYLGTTRDTERSYFTALTPGFLLAMLTGFHAVRVLLARDQAGPVAAPLAKPGGSLGPVLRGLAMHLVVIALLLRAAGWEAALAWVLGIAVVYPVFATLRQVAEHRSVSVDPACDYSREDQGAVTRLFGAGWLATIVGGAGFNRHLLHHWEPQVSCTRLAELERYLRTTSVAPLLAARTTTYGAALAAIWRHDNR